MLLHIVLRNLTCVLPSRLIEEVRRILFLDQCIATVLLICKDGTHCGDVPLVLSRRRFDAALLQLFCDGIEGSAAKEEFVDESHDFCLFFVDLEILVIAETLPVVEQNSAPPQFVVYGVGRAADLLCDAAKGASVSMSDLDDDALFISASIV